MYRLGCYRQKLERMQNNTCREQFKLKKNAVCKNQIKNLLSIYTFNCRDQFLFRIYGAIKYVK
uniref:Uncharacterized protein n=1 Tax=Rhizophora mucronata TaxID=61149 RepID=A0A2P2NMN2_RHIMU